MPLRRATYGDHHDRACAPDVARGMPHLAIAVLAADVLERRGVMPRKPTWAICAMVVACPVPMSKISPASPSEPNRCTQRAHDVVDEHEIAAHPAVFVQRNAFPFASQAAEQRRRCRCRDSRSDWPGPYTFCDRRQANSAPEAQCPAADGCVPARAWSRRRCWSDSAACSSAANGKASASAKSQHADSSISRERWPGLNSTPSRLRHVPSPYTARELLSTMRRGTCPAADIASSMTVLPVRLTCACRVASLEGLAGAGFRGRDARPPKAAIPTARRARCTVRGRRPRRRAQPNDEDPRDAGARDAPGGAGCRWRRSARGCARRAHATTRCR